MPDYSVEVSATAERQLRKLQAQDQLRIVRALRKLAIEPRARGTRRLRGYDDVYRLRVSQFRIIYSIEDRKLIVIMLKIGHRRDVYRGDVA